MTHSAVFHPSLALVILLTALPVGATAQTVTVSGRVLDATSADPVARATVSVESRFTITDDDGTFVLAGIESGSQVLTIHAFGYDTIRTELVLSRDTVVEVALTPVPVRLDPVHGAARTVVLRGVVRDPGSDRIVRYVAVLADGGRSARSDRLGRFQLDVPQDAPTTVSLTSFGYLPLRRTVELHADTGMTFYLAPDEVVHRMIAREVQRLDERATPLRTVGMPALDRESLLGSDANLYQLLESRRYTARVRCVLVDDVQYLGEDRAGILRTMLPADVERVELLYRGQMLRVYTRDFIRRMVLGQVQIRPPVYVRETDPPVCR